MPSKDDIAWNLVNSWTETYGGYALQRKGGRDILLYWNYSEDFQNHAHFFFENGQWFYTIKCNNEGINRVQHNVNIHQSLADLMSEVVDNWRLECPQYTSMQNGGSRLGKKNRKFKKSRKQRNKSKKMRKSRKNKK